MGTGLLIMLREGFEAALVVAIVFAYLRKIERLELGRAVWQGVAAASAMSIGIGVIVHLTIGDLEGVARFRAFAAISLLALVVLTWMVFWMKRQAQAIKGDLEQRVDVALQSDNVRRGVMAVALLAVLREGVEAALFLIAAATEETGRDVLVGGLVGLGAAAVAAFVVYLGGRRIPMRAFFKVTGLVLIVFAAGLAARSVMYLQVGSGDLRSFNLNGVYDLRRYAWLTQGTEVGKFLAAMLGWDPRPSIEQVIVYLGYLVPVGWLYWRPEKGEPAVARAETAALPADATPEATDAVGSLMGRAEPVPSPGALRHLDPAVHP